MRPLELSKHPADVTAPATTLAETDWKERAERARVIAATERIVDNMVRVRGCEWRKFVGRVAEDVRVSDGAT